MKQNTGEGDERAEWTVTCLVHLSGQRRAQELMAHQRVTGGNKGGGDGGRGMAGCKGGVVWLAGKVLMSALGRDLEARQNRPLKGAQSHSRRLQEVERYVHGGRGGIGGVTKNIYMVGR